MESSGTPPTPGEAAAALADAEAARTSLANEIIVPPFFFASIGAAIALHIATAAAGWAGAGEGAIWLLWAGLLPFCAVSWYQLVSFRRLNGVWLGGFGSHVVGGIASAASVSYVAAFGGATWAAFADVWWLVPFFAVAGGAGYALSGRGWMRRYRSEPAIYGRQESAALWTVWAALALGGLALLITQS